MLSQIQNVQPVAKRCWFHSAKMESFLAFQGVWPLHPRNLTASLPLKIGKGSRIGPYLPHLHGLATAEL